MANRRRSSTSRAISTRRKPRYTWAEVSLDLATVVAGGKTIIDLMSLVSARLPSLTGVTAVRMLLELMVRGATSTGRYVAGITPSTTDSFSGGTGNYSPARLDVDWYWWRQAIFEPSTESLRHQVPIDIRTSRRLGKQDENLVFCINNVSAISMTFALNGRVLLRLP